MEEHKRQEETGKIEEETLEAVRQKAAWSVKQPLCVLQMHVIVHCRCLMHFKNPYACVLYNEICLWWSLLWATISLMLCSNDAHLHIDKYHYKIIAFPQPLPISFCCLKSMSLFLIVNKKKFNCALEQDFGFTFSCYNHMMYNYHTLLLGRKWERNLRSKLKHRMTLPSFETSMIPCISKGHWNSLM